jgi:serine/threonine protein kinase
VVERHGQGGYGAVYRALRIGQEDAGPVALKLSLYPWDARFARAGALLSRLRHPRAPRLLGHGFWRPPSSGVEHPYLVIEWVEGSPLYQRRCGRTRGLPQGPLWGLALSREEQGPLIPGPSPATAPPATLPAGRADPPPARLASSP